MSNIIGERIDRLLKENGIKQKELAKKMNVTDNTISYFVRGTRTPNIQQIIEIADFFNVSTDYLLGRSEIASTDPEINAIHNYTGLSQKSIEALYIIYHGLDERFIKTINFLIENESVKNFCIHDGELTINPEADKLNIIFQISEYFSTIIDCDKEFLIRRNGVVVGDENMKWYDRLYRSGNFFLKDVVNTTMLQDIQKKLEIAKERYNKLLNNSFETKKSTSND